MESNVGYIISKYRIHGGMLSKKIGITLERFLEIEHFLVKYGY